MVPASGPPHCNTHSPFSTVYTVWHQACCLLTFGLGSLPTPHTHHGHLLPYCTQLLPHCLWHFLCHTLHIVAALPTPPSHYMFPLLPLGLGQFVTTSTHTLHVPHLGILVLLLCHFTHFWDSGLQALHPTPIPFPTYYSIYLPTPHFPFSLPPFWTLLGCFLEGGTAGAAFPQDATQFSTTFLPSSHLLNPY